VKLVPVYSARDPAQAHLLAEVLRSNDIPAQVGDTAANAIWALAVKVFVHQIDAARARSVVAEFVHGGATERNKDAAPWRCPGCGELIEPQFTDCWNCQTPRPDSSDNAETSAGSGGEVPRPPPDPAVPIDVACVRCGYNLRTLAVDALCPECGHPVFPSVLAKLRSIDALADETSLSADALLPCLDYFEHGFGFPIEAIAFAEYVWARGGYRDVDALTAAVEDQAAEFFGDRVTARRALERWNIRTSDDLRRLITSLVDLRVLTLA
jgi:hypothetical protein